MKTIPTKSKAMCSGVGQVRTRRLIVRPFVSGDYAAWKAGYKGRKKPQNQFDAGPKEISRADFLKWLKSKNQLHRRDLQYVYGIFDRKTGAHLGTIDFLISIRLAVQMASIGYQIHNQFWGQGFAKEGLKAACTIAFRDLKLHRLEAQIEKGNRRSVAVAKSIGMKREALRRKFLYDEGQWIDLENYVLTQEACGFKSKPSIRTTISNYWVI